MIPLVHDLGGETVLVFGGGTVGARKARRFAREARTVVLSPDFADADFGAADLVRAAPDPSGVGAWLDAADPALVVAATDDGALNAAVERAARDREVLVNRADRSGGRGAGSVVVPATLRDGPVRVAVTTSGTSPAVSRHLRDELAPVVAGAGAVARVVADVREELRDHPLSAESRREAVRTVATAPAVWAAARESRGEGEEGGDEAAEGAGEETGEDGANQGDEAVRAAAERVLAATVEEWES